MFKTSFPAFFPAIQPSVLFAQLIQLHIWTVYLHIYMFDSRCSPCLCFVGGYACTCAGPSCCERPGAWSTRRHNRPEFINVVHFPSSVCLWPPCRSTLQSNIPHTPLELRERPVVRQGRSSGMSLLSQGERMERGREQRSVQRGPAL